MFVIRFFWKINEMEKQQKESVGSRDVNLLKVANMRYIVNDRTDIENSSRKSLVTDRKEATISGNRIFI